MVTGASRGLGRNMALALARAGADLVVTSRSKNSLETLVKEIESIGSSAYAVELDVRDDRSIKNAATVAISIAGKIDILVNNAGCNIRKPALEMSWEDWNEILDTNLRGAFFMAQAMAKPMIRRRHGRIINIGSVTSVSGSEGIAPYCASKGGIKQLTMSLADEWGKFGVTVNCLAPGWFKTHMNEVLYQNREWVEYLLDRIPLKRPGAPHDLDGIIVFLASDASAYLTGQTILVDGGISTGATRALPFKWGRQG